MAKEANGKSLEAWIWDAACSIRGAKDAPKYKDYILPLIFTKRLCDVFDDELNRIAKEVGSRAKAFKLTQADWKKANASGQTPIVRFYLPLKPDNPDEPVWSVIRKLADKIGEQLTSHLRAIADENPLLKGIIDRVDFNATTHGVPDLADDRLSNLIERISEKRLGLADVEPDIIGRSYEYLIRKFAEGSVSSAGESAGLLIKCQLVLDQKMSLRSKKNYAPLMLYGQEYIAETWAMANMNMIIHDTEGAIEIGDTFKNPKFRKGNRLRTFDGVVTNPMWNQDWWTEKDYDADELDCFPKGAGFPGRKADWGWVQIVLASLNDPSTGSGRAGRAAIVLDTGAASRGSGNANTNKKKDVRRWFVERDVVEGVVYLPENLFYNTTAPGIILFLNKAKPRDRKGKLFLVNASREFSKGDPKNYLPEEGIKRIVEAFLSWKEQDKFSRIVGKDEIAKNDFNISPSRYIHTGEADEYRPIAEIAEELRDLETATAESNTKLDAILSKLGF